MFIAIASQLAVIVGESNISGEIYYPSVKQCAGFKITGGIKYFKMVQIFQKYLFRGVQIFQNICTGGTKNGGSGFLVTGQAIPAIIRGQPRGLPSTSRTSS